MPRAQCCYVPSLLLVATVSAFLGAGRAVADGPVVGSGVNVVADGLPSFGDPAVIWYTPASTCAAVPAAVATIQRTSTFGVAPREILGIRESPLHGCRVYTLASNIAVDGSSLFFVDNVGPNGHWALERRSRNANASDPSVLLADLGTSLSSAEVNAQYPTVLFVIVHRPDLGATDAIVEYDKVTPNTVLNAGIETGPENQLHGMQYDGRYLYWINGLLLRADDTSNGAKKTVITGGFTSYHPEGYSNECDPVCSASAPVVYGQGNRLLRTDTVTGGVVQTLYTSADSGASIGAITQDQTHYFFFERHATGPGLGAPVEDLLNRISSLGVNQSADVIYGPIVAPTGPTGSGLGFDSLTTDLAYLYFHDRVAGALLKVANDAAAIPIRKLRATGLEITQGIQDASNGVPLIRGRRTFVRFYVKSDDGSDVPNVSASLDVSNANQILLGHLEPVNQTGKLLRVKANPSRLNVDDAFLFELPLDWTTGTNTLSLTATVNPSRSVAENEYSDDRFTLVSPTIQDSPRLPLEVIKLWYHYNQKLIAGGITQDIDSENFMNRVYPLAYPGGSLSDPGPGLRVIPSFLIDDDLGSYVDRSNKLCTGLGNGCAATQMNSKLQSMVTAGDLPNDRHYWGSIPNDTSVGNLTNCPDGKGATYPCFTRGFTPGGSNMISSGPMLDTTNASPDQEYMAHEVGHQLGRNHPGSGGPPSAPPGAAPVCPNQTAASGPLDASYPYSGPFPFGPAIGKSTGAKDDETALAGFDPGQPGNALEPQQIRNASAYADYMGYCTPLWTSDYTYGNSAKGYGGLYQAMIDSTLKAAALPRAAAAAQPGDWLLAFGGLSLVSNTGFFTSVRRLGSVADVPPIVPGSFALELRDGAGGLLASHPFTPTPAAEAAPGQESFGLVVPFAAGTRSIRIVDVTSQKVIVTKAVSANAPVVSDVALVGAPSPVTGEVTVAWTASDDDGDPLRFDLLYSHDAGASWRPVHLSIADTTVQLDTSILGGGTGMLRVEASDGSQSARADSAPFTVAPKPPNVSIQNPASAVHIQWGQLVTFAGHADDPQGQPLPNASFVWTSPYRSPLGTGPAISVTDLEVGEYDVTLTVTNAAALTGTATVHVFVGDRLEAPAARLAASPVSISWSVPESGAGLQAASLAISNASGNDSFPFTATSSASWLQVNGLSQAGVAAFAPVTLNVTADPTSLPAAQASVAQIVLTHTGDPTDTLVIPVSLAKGGGLVGEVVGDTDADGILDDVDNCVLVPNPSQLDADQDGYGNACDADLNEDGVVNFGDLALMKKVFFKADATADLNGDGVVNFQDLAIMKSAFFKAPGRSGLACAGHAPCGITTQ